MALDGWWPSFGAGLTAREARTRARAEAIERASAVFRGDEPRVRASYRALAGAALHPESCTLFSPRQRRASSRAGRSLLLRVPPRLDPGARLEWSPLWSLSERRLTYLPTRSLYFKYRGNPRGLLSADSNGLAAAPTRNQAALRALLELIERDSVALWWYNRAPRPGVPLEDRPDRAVQQLLSCYRAAEREVWALDLTSDLGVPVCVAVSRRRGPREDLAFGFGAGLAMDAALRHALREMAQPLAARAAGGRGGAGTARFERWRRGARAAGEPHLLPAAGAPRARRALRPGRGGSGDGLRRLVRRLAHRDCEVLACDLTRRGAPLAVVRVVVPGLRHCWPRFAPGRLYQAPVAAGWRVRALREPELNPVPLLL